MGSVAEQFNALVCKSSGFAHQIALAHIKEQEITPSMLLDYSAAMYEAYKFLADMDYVTPEVAGVNTSRGPLIIEDTEDGPAVSTFHREYLLPEDMDQDDAVRVAHIMVQMQDMRFTC